LRRVHQGEGPEELLQPIAEAAVELDLTARNGNLQTGESGEEALPGIKGVHH